MTSLHALLRARWRRDPDRVFLSIPGGPRWTYGALDELAADMGEVLRQLGATRGSRVMVQVDKSAEAVALYLGTLRIGAIYTPLNPAYTAAEVRYFADDADPAVVVATDEDIGRHLPSGGALVSLSVGAGGSLMDRVRSVAERTPPTPSEGSEAAAMLYTSGTTGRSKGAVLSSDNLVSNAVSLHRIWGWQDDDVLLHALPIFHTHGLFVALHCAMLGASAVIFLPRFSPDAAIAQLPESTVMMAVPTHYHRLLEAPDFSADRCASMRVFISGSAPLSAAAHTAFEERTGHAILERYGMTEAGMITSNPYTGPRIAGTVGYPLPEVELRVVDDAGAPLPAGVAGQVEVRGPNVFGGYWNRVDKTAEAFRDGGYFRTGDVGRVAEDGRLTLAGRASDMIISGGLNVYPKEVELVLDEVTGVAESAVVGIPHPDYGEAVVAFVVGEAAEPLLRRACEQRLAAFKRPKIYRRVDELPRNAMGKVQKQRLREGNAELF